MDLLTSEMLNEVCTHLENHTNLSMTCWAMYYQCELFVKSVKTEDELIAAIDKDKLNELTMRRHIHDYLTKDLPWDSKWGTVFCTMIRWIVLGDYVDLYKKICERDYKHRLLAIFYNTYNTINFTGFQAPKIFEMLHSWALTDKKIANYHLFSLVNAHVSKSGEEPIFDERVKSLLTLGANPLFGMCGGFMENSRFFVDQNENDVKDEWGREYCCFTEFAYIMTRESLKCSDDDIGELIEYPNDCLHDIIKNMIHGHPYHVRSDYDYLFEGITCGQAVYSLAHRILAHPKFEHYPEDDWGIPPWLPFEQQVQLRRQRGM